MLAQNVTHSENNLLQKLLDEVFSLQQENLRLKLELKCSESLLKLEQRLSEIDRKSKFRVNKYF